MIIGKNSAKLGFPWLAISILKLIVGVATIAYIGQFIVLGIIGIIAILFFTWEQLKEYKKIGKGI